MIKLILKTFILVFFFFFFVSWHIKIIFLYLIFISLRKLIPFYQENKKTINRSVFILFLLSFWILFPNRTSDKNDYIQSVYFNKKDQKKIKEPLIPYLTNIVGEGDIMATVSLLSYIIPENYIRSGALGDVIHYNKSTYFFNNNFHNFYRELAQKGSPPHNVPFQIMQDLGFYKNMTHYFLHVPDVDNLEDCEVIVFCHGYSGSWILYPALFAKHTDAIIIAVESPSFSGYFSKNVMNNIIHKTLPNAFKQIGIPYKKPHLIGLSNGGSAINSSVSYYPNVFKSFTILSASLNNYPKTNKKVHIIYGSNDRSGGVSSKIPKSKYVIHKVKDEDHSLIVAHPDITFKFINKIITQ